MKLILIMAFTGLFMVPFAYAEAPGAPKQPTIQEKILTTFNDRRMIAVLNCESGLKQFGADGKVLTSPTADRGVAQINQVHWKRAKELGLDIINSEDDNLKMAKIIYDEEGIKAWTCFQKLSPV